MQKGFAWPLILVLVLVLGIGGFLGYKYLNQVTRLNPELPKPLPVASSIVATSSATAVQPDKVQLFSDTDSGFEFKIPKGYVVKEESEEEYFVRVNGNLRKNFTDFVYYEPAKLVKSWYVVDDSEKKDTNPFSVWVFENPDNLNGEEFYEKYWYYPVIWGEFGTEEKKKYAPNEESIVSGAIGEYPVKGYGKVVDYQIGAPTFVYAGFKDKMFLLRIVSGDQKTGDAVFKSFRFPAKTESLNQESPAVQQQM